MRAINVGVLVKNRSCFCIVGFSAEWSNKLCRIYIPWVGILYVERGISSIGYDACKAVL